MAGGERGDFGCAVGSICFFLGAHNFSPLKLLEILLFFDKLSKSHFSTFLLKMIAW